MKILSGLKYNTLFLGLLVITCGFFILSFPSDDLYSSFSLYRSNYAVLLGSFIFCSVLLGTKLRDKNLFLFDPFLFVSVLFFCIFLIQPMIDILQNRVDFYGFTNPAYGCKKGTLLFVLAYVFFYIGSFFIKKPNTNKQLYQPFTPFKKSAAASFSFILWVVFTLLCVVFLIANGYSVRYIFTLGQFGEAHVDELFSRLGFLWKFSLSMIVSFMYYFQCGRSKLLKTLMFLTTLFILILNGGRALLFVFLAAPVVLYYTKRAKNPPIQFVVIALSLFLVFAAGVQAARWGLRSGGNVEVETKWDMETIIYPMRSNFSIYKMYYLVVDAMPRQINYLWGQETILYTAIMFVPRALWPDKPDTPIREIHRYVAGDLAVLNGEASPGLTEFYMDFGWLGCILFGFVFGWLVVRLKNLYLYSSADNYALVLYSVLYPLLFQVVIRGYIPSLFYSVLCIFLPYFILKMVIPDTTRGTRNEI